VTLISKLLGTEQLADKLREALKTAAFVFDRCMAAFDYKTAVGRAQPAACLDSGELHQ